MALAPVVLAGCVLAPSRVSSVGSFGGGAGASPAGGAGQITVPSLFGLPKEQAIAALRRAGYQGDPSEDSSQCGSVVDGRVMELGQVCYQHPPAGRTQGARLPISIRVQRGSPWHGNAGRANEWRLMPALIGMSVEQAQARLQEVGLARGAGVRVMWVDEPGCRPRTVCRTEPAPLERAAVSRPQVVFAGRDPEAKPSAPAEADPPPAPASPSW
jgi:beta-lactam-binding protein with PASTA domain